MRLRSLLYILLAAAFGSSLMAAQTPSQYTVTGNLSGISTSSSDVLQVRFSLANCGTANPVVPGVTNIVQKVMTFTASSGGNFTGQLWGNDLISCNLGMTTVYQVTFLRNNIPTGITSIYRIVAPSPWNLTTAEPVATLPSVNVPASGYLCDAGKAMAGIASDWTPICEPFTGSQGPAGPQGPPGPSGVGTGGVQLQGDVTTPSATSGQATVARINGTVVPVNTAANQALVTNAAGNASWLSIPDCGTDGTQELRYSTSTHTYSCIANRSGSSPSGTPLAITAYDATGALSSLVGATTDSVTRESVTLIGPFLAPNVSNAYIGSQNDASAASLLGSAPGMFISDYGDSNTNIIGNFQAGFLSGYEGYPVGTSYFDYKNGADIYTGVNTPGFGFNMAQNLNFQPGTYNGSSNGAFTGIIESYAPGRNYEGMYGGSPGSTTTQGFYFQYNGLTSGNKNAYNFMGGCFGSDDCNFINSNMEYGGGFEVQSPGEGTAWLKSQNFEAPNAIGYGTTTVTNESVSGSTVTPATISFSQSGDKLGVQDPIIDVQSGVGFTGVTVQSVTNVGGSNSFQTVQLNGGQTVSVSTGIGHLAGDVLVPIAPGNDNLFPAYVTQAPIAVVSGAYNAGDAITLSGSQSAIESTHIIGTPVVGGATFNGGTNYILGQYVNDGGFLYVCNSTTCPAGQNPPSSTYWYPEGTSSSSILIATVTARYKHGASSQTWLCANGLAGGYAMEINNQTTYTPSGTWTYEFPITCSRTTTSFDTMAIVNSGYNQSGIGDGNITLHKYRDITRIVKLPSQISLAILETSDGVPMASGDTYQISNYPYLAYNYLQLRNISHNPNASYGGISLSNYGPAANGVFFDAVSGTSGATGTAYKAAGDFAKAFTLIGNGPSQYFLGMCMDAAGNSTCTSSTQYNFLRFNGYDVIKVEGDNKQLYYTTANNFTSFTSTLGSSSTDLIQSASSTVHQLSVENDANPSIAPYIAVAGGGSIGQMYAMKNVNRPSDDWDIGVSPTYDFSSSFMNFSLNGTQWMELGSTGVLSLRNSDGSYGTVCTSLNYACGAFYNPAAVDITGGTIDGVAIGGGTRSTGAFTSGAFTSLNITNTDDLVNLKSGGLGSYVTENFYTSTGTLAAGLGYGDNSGSYTNQFYFAGNGHDLCFDATGSASCQIKVSGTTGVTFINNLQLGSTYEPGTSAATGSIAVQDSTGTTYYILVRTTP